MANAISTHSCLTAILCSRTVHLLIGSQDCLLKKSKKNIKLLHSYFCFIDKNAIVRLVGCFPILREAVTQRYMEKRNLFQHLEVSYGRDVTFV